MCIRDRRWGLEGRGRAAFSSLSGGEQQRLFVALALINQPQVVFLDELTQGLDPAARRVAWDLVRSVRDRGATVILVTHFMEEAQQLCDRVAVVHRGRVAAVDSPQGLISRYGGGVRVVFSTQMCIRDRWERPRSRGRRATSRSSRYAEVIRVRSSPGQFHEFIPRG